MSSLTQARALLAEVSRYATDGDDERAHRAEDALRRFALEAIAGDATPAEARELAEIALATRTLSFARWCA